MVAADMDGLLDSLGQVESHYFRREARLLRPADFTNETVHQFILKYGRPVDCPEELPISWGQQQAEWVNLVRTWNEQETIDEARKNNALWIEEDVEFVSRRHDDK